MKVITLSILLAFFCASLSCGGGAQRFSPNTKADPIPLLVWVQSDSGLSIADMTKACEEWKVKGIKCHLTTSKLDADVRIYVDDKDECKPNKKGSRTLARAWRGGRIVFYTKCYGKSKEKLSSHMLRAVATHEYGHQLGIWKHVPLSCDAKKIKLHISGKKICGKAVMNPYYDKEVHFVTPVDSLAFDVRNRFIGVVKDYNVDDEPTTPPDCIFEER